MIIKHLEETKFRFIMLIRFRSIWIWAVFFRMEASWTATPKFHDLVLCYSKKKLKYLTIRVYTQSDLRVSATGVHKKPFRSDLHLVLLHRKYVLRVIGFGHDGEPARSTLEISTSALLMRWRTNQSCQSSFDQITFYRTDSHERVRHSGPPQNQLIWTVGSRRTATSWTWTTSILM